MKPIEALERDAVRDQVLQRAVLFENLTVAPGRRPHRITITVTLSYRGQTETAEEEAADTPRSRVEGAAKAAVAVLDRLLTDSSLALEGAKIVEGVRPGVRLRGGAGAGRAGDAAADAARRRSRRARSGRRCSRCWTRRTGGRRRGGRSRRAGGLADGRSVGRNSEAQLP